MGLITQFATTTTSLEGQISGLALRTVGGSALLLIILLVISSQVKDKHPKAKLPLFGAIATVILGSTIFLIGSTIYLNLVSDSKGPVHWHANVEYWACGTELELRDPYQFLSNKIGSPVLHEHDDKWIHLEGVVVDLDEDATIGHFMKTIGGSLDDTRITIPLNNDQLIEDETDGDISSTDNISQLEGYTTATEDGGRLIDLSNGKMCGSNQGEVQVFVYQFDKETDTYKQIKLKAGKEVYMQEKAGELGMRTLGSVGDYIYRDTGNIPPGDCIIFEFDTPKNYTDKLCKQFGLKDTQRCVEFGVTEFNEKQCNIRDVTDYGIVDEEAENVQTISMEEYCSPHYDQTGRLLTDTDIETKRSNGSLVIPEEDCADYQLATACPSNLDLTDSCIEVLNERGLSTEEFQQTAEETN